MAKHSPSLFSGAGIQRPAIIETSFASEEACITAKDFYAGLLGSVPASAKPPYIFEVVAQMALILTVSDDGTARTTIYWELADNTSDNLKKVYKELQEKHKCREIKGKGPHKPPYKSLLKGDTELCTLLDPAGSVFGLVINPPIPLG